MSVMSTDQALELGSIGNGKSTGSGSFKRGNSVKRDLDPAEVASIVSGTGTLSEGKIVSHEWLCKPLWRAVVYYLAVLCSGGILYVFLINRPSLLLGLRSSICSAAEATMVRVKLKDGSTHVVDIEKSDINDGACMICFEVMATRYYSMSEGNFSKIWQIPDEPAEFSDKFVCGLGSKPSRHFLEALYGLNMLKLPIADPFTAVMLEVLSPFYLFQYFAVAVWLYTEYIIYSVVVICITCGSIYFVCSDKLFNMKRLEALAASNEVITRTDRNGAPLDSSSGVSDSLLVPGDCFIISLGMILPCDAVLISGRVVVDEAMLTGESVPVTKTPFVKSASDFDATKRVANIVYCGTKVVSIGNADSKPIAMTYRTGFRSAKGSIVAVLAQPPLEIVSFMPDAIRAILFMVIITTAIFGWSASQLKEINSTDEDVVIAYLTALTIAVPPGLVACLSIATSIAVTRLTKKNITISDTSKLNAAGYVSIACFDKTGTLTDENIVYQGSLLYEPDSEGVVTESTSAGVTLINQQIMATCNALSVLGDDAVGDQLEVELLRASGWKLNETQGKNILATPPNQSTAYTLLRHFEYSPDKLRSGTLLQRPSENGGGVVYIIKGSPEKIIELCKKKSVPASIERDLIRLGNLGYRVLACAYRNCNDPIESLMGFSQDELEHGMEFLGLIYFSNKLKNDTYPKTIQNLRDANIQVSMITGDHISTAIAIATDCHILPPVENRELYVIDADVKGDILITSHKLEQVVSDVTVASLLDQFDRRSSDASNKSQLCLAVTGAAINNFMANNLEETTMLRLFRAANVFARTKPAQKKLIVTQLKRPLVLNGLQTYVMFCGDGANDMEALACATVGVSLCDTATTVAASIVSTTQSPFATVDVLKEGRCSLVTAYVLVCFNIMYAIIQLFMTCYLNNIGLVFGDATYLVQDMFFSLFLGLCIANTPASDTLDVKLPPKRLFTVGLMVKLFVQLAIFPIFQQITLEALKTQDWYTQFDAGDDPLTVAWSAEESALNIIALAQLMIASVVVTIGQPFRQPWYTNKWHLIVMLFQSGYIFVLLFLEGTREGGFNKLVTNKPAPNDFQGILIGLIAANVVASAIATKLADFCFRFDE